ncbi:MAG: hypothetical protein ACFFAO_12730 [Candidatus Hermodarchaeota archaeon]
MMMEFHKVMRVDIEPHNIFNFLNRLQNIKKYSLPLLEHLTIEELSNNRIGLGSTFKCSGRIFGKKLDFIISTVQWISNKKIINHSFSGLEFTLIFELDPIIDGTEIKIDLYYTLPFSWSRDIDINLANKVINMRLNLMFNYIKKSFEYEYKNTLKTQQYAVST